MRPLIAILILLVAGVATAADPVEVCRQCPPTRPGTWEPIHYPTPLRNFLFGSARFRPDPNYRWQPGQWVPIDARQAVVQVRAQISPTTTIMGSGVYITHTGKRGVLMAAHVAGNSTEAEVTWHDGSVQRGPVTICNLPSGAAWIQVERPEITPLPLASSMPRSSDQLTFMGYSGKEPVLQQWLGSYTEQTRITTEARQVNRLAKYDAHTSHGHAGGPILNRQGEVVGILSHGSGQSMKMDDWYVYPESMGPELRWIRRFVAHEVPREGDGR